ncbi:uncharacterized protein LOC111064881 [Drosophila obscura]|uniref:uncharacterized protein LOC111064881 n=1 Tax=Drosophila obscura TaxID=7282 RepID=UPI001BB21C59|nr:uncharacterized protein LOC111064881 [Drosophila obscura]
MNSEQQQLVVVQEEHEAPHSACCNRNGCLVSELKKLVLWCDWRPSLLAFVLLHIFIDYAAMKSVICAAILLALAVLSISMIYGLYLRSCEIYEGGPIQEYPNITLFICPQWSDRVTNFLNNFLAKMRLIASMEQPLEAFKWVNMFVTVFIVGSSFDGVTLAKIGLCLLFGIPPIYVWNQQQKDLQLEKLKLLEKFHRCGKAVGDLNTQESFVLNDTLVSLEQNNTEDSFGLNDNQETILLNDTLNTEESFGLNDNQETILLNDTLNTEESFGLNDNQETIVLNDTLETEESFGLNDNQETYDIQESFEPKNIQESTDPKNTTESLDPKNCQESLEPNDTKESFGLNQTQASIELNSTEFFDPNTTEEFFGPKNTHESVESNNAQD